MGIFTEILCDTSKWLMDHTDDGNPIVGPIGQEDPYKELRKQFPNVDWDHVSHCSSAQKPEREKTVGEMIDEQLSDKDAEIAHLRSENDALRDQNDTMRNTLDDVERWARRNS